MPSRLAPVVAAAACCLGLGACQSDDAPPRAEATATPDPAEIRSGLGSLFAGDNPGDQETRDGTCFGKELTERVTPGELRDAGLLDPSYDVVPTVPNLPDDVAGHWVDAQFACTDFVEASTRAQVKVTKGGIDQQAYASCLRGEVTEDDLRTAVESTLTGRFDAPEVAALSRAQSTCADQAS